MELCWQSNVSVFFNVLSRFVIYSFSSKEQASFNFTAAVTICSDFGAFQNKVSHCLIVSPSICHGVIGLDIMILVFWMLSFKPDFSLPSFIFIKRLVSFSSLYKGGVICISEVIIISPSNCDSSLCFIQPAFCMMYFVYKLNKQVTI